jgi:outer membrane protein assembly factor BamB
VPGKRAPTQKTNGFTSPTPASDGKLVVTFNGFGIAACWDLQGKRQWIKYLATPANQYGSSASVAIAGNQAIIHVRDVVYALDIATGKQTWQSPSPSRWGSPVVARVGDRLLIVTAGGDFIDSADGKALARHVADLNYNAPVVSDGVVYFMCGEQGCKAIKLPDKIVDGWKPQVLWSSQVNKSNRTYSSPVVWDGMVYLLTQTSRLSAFDAKTGALAWEEDLKLGPTAYPSLLIAGKFLLASSDTGKTAVLEPGRSYKELGRNALDPFRSTPVIVDDKMYVRTRAGMVCIKGEE